MTHDGMTRDEIVIRLIEFCGQLADEGACACCINTALLIATLAGGECADAIRSLSPLGVTELRQALNEATTAH